MEICGFCEKEICTCLKKNDELTKQERNRQVATQFYALVDAVVKAIYILSK